MGLQWTEDLEVDQGLIDSDHKFLIKLINGHERLSKKVSNAKDALYMVDGLKKYALVHFQREERLQEAVGFPTAVEHQQEHLKFKKFIDEIAVEMQTASLMDLAAIETKLNVYLSNWLKQHILIEDMKMKPYAGKMAAPQADLPSLHEHLRYLEQRGTETENAT